jgi:hypothetical protein
MISFHALMRGRLQFTDASNRPGLKWCNRTRFFIIVFNLMVSNRTGQRATK